MRQTDISEQDLLKALHSLSGERQPGRDLWPGIDARLDDRGSTAEQPRRRWLGGFGVAAGLMLAMLVGYQFGTRQLQTNGITGPPIELAARQAMVPELTGLSREYQGVLQELVMGGPDAAGLISPYSEFEISNTLNELQQLAAQLRGQLRAQPDNAYLAAWLVRLEAEEISLIRQVRQLDERSGRIL